MTGLVLFNRHIMRGFLEAAIINGSHLARGIQTARMQGCQQLGRESLAVIPRQMQVAADVSMRILT
jgi:hypothetical protein